MGIKERTTSILLLLFLMGGLEQDVVLLDQELLELFELPSNTKTRSTLRALVKKEYVDCVNREKQSYRITKLGLQELSLSFPYVRFATEQWDGKWRIVSYEIPESKRKMRDTLRRKMVSWGLGPWHRSFWITPHPIIMELKGILDVMIPSEYVQAFESEHVVGERGILIDKVWKRDELEKQYRALFKTWHTILSEEEAQSKKLQKVLLAFVEVLKVDPGLPIELLGKEWVGYESMGIFQDIRRILYNK